MKIPSLLGMLLRLALLTSLLYVMVCLAIFAAQRRLLYFPTPANQASAGDFTLSLPDADLRVAARPRTGERAVLYLGGNAEDVAATIPTLEAIFPDRALYALHYRSYGGSSGVPSEPVLHRDAEALFRHVHDRHPEVIVVGRSLGSGLAVRLAAEHPVQRLVLLFPYDSILRVARTAFPFLPVNWLLRDRYEAWRDAPRVGAPTVIVAAAEDRVIPVEHAQRLHQAFPPGRAELRIIEGIDHNTPIAAAPELVDALMGR